MHYMFAFECTVIHKYVFLLQFDIDLINKYENVTKLWSIIKDTCQSFTYLTFDLIIVLKANVQI